MDPSRIAELLEPFLENAPTVRNLSFRGGYSPEESAFLSESQLKQISTYLDLLLRWNARVNLTAVRKPEEIVTRHFGESLFVARCLFPTRSTWGQPPSAVPELHDLLDLGSGAGFPGLPIKIWAPSVHVTLIESNQKKATFLREVVRTLGLTDLDVFPERAETFPIQAQVVTLRAIEHFETILPTALRLVEAGGRIALLIGEGQVAVARKHAIDVTWNDPIPIPLSLSRVLLIGRLNGRNQTEHEPIP